MRLLAPLIGRRARLRWLHLIIGGALLMPYFLVGTVLVSMLGGGEELFSSPPAQFAAFACALPMVAVSGFFPLVRPLSVAAARALCGVPPALLAEGPPGPGRPGCGPPPGSRCIWRSAASSAGSRWH